MWAIKAAPKNIILSAFIANTIGSFGVAFCGLFLVDLYQSGPSASAFFASLLAGGYAALFGTLIVFLYAAPLLAFMRSIHYGGPVVALIIGFAPGLGFALQGATFELNPFLLFGGAVSIVFCFLAYGQPFSNKTLQSPASQAGTSGSDAASGP